VPAAQVPALLADLAAGVAPEAAIAAHADDPGPSRLMGQAGLIERAFAGQDMAAIMGALRADGSAFALETLGLLSKNAPTSLVFALYLLRQAAQSTGLEPCLDREYAANALFLQGHDFYEGVRAAVIDKDRSPKWHPATLEAVDALALIKALRPLPSLFAAV